VLHKIQPDEVYNLAGQSSVALSFEQAVETFDSLALGSSIFSKLSALLSSQAIAALPHNWEILLAGKPLFQGNDHPLLTQLIESRGKH